MHAVLDVILTKLDVHHGCTNGTKRDNDFVEPRVVSRGAWRVWGMIKRVLPPSSATCRGWFLFRKKRRISDERPHGLMFVSLPRRNLQAVVVNYTRTTGLIQMPKTSAFEV